MLSSRSDLAGGILFVVLGAILIFWLIPDWVEPDPDLRLPVDLVPKIVAIGFVLCGAALLIKAFTSKRSSGKQSIGQHSNVRQSAEGFADGEFRGLLLLIVMLIASTVAFQRFHFLMVAPVLVALSMWMYSPIRLLSLITTSIVGPVLIWLLATQILGRVLP